MHATVTRRPRTPMEKANEKLTEMFGFGDFRAGQQQVIAQLLEGNSAVAIFPTGGGKSLCYQLPALILDGLTVVVSPLIALMKDQIDFLRERKIAAARLDSSMQRDEAVQVYDDIRAGRIRLLYVSPERLGNERFLHLLERQRIALLAVDEAHCISEWGHNFRPDYLRIAALADSMKVERVLALSATATPEVVRDIAQAFHINTQSIVQTGFYRPNLQLRVTACADRDRRSLLLKKVAERIAGSAIVYVTLQRTAEEIAALLVSQGHPARAYHAGMKPEERTAVQDEFMSSDNLIVVATIAFGMGIDKSNIRAVYHFNLPKSLESYMQEIGRAGRDGQAAVCELLACQDDVVILENFSYGDTPTSQAVQALTSELLEGSETLELSLYDLSVRHDIRELVVKTLLTYLELEGILQSTGSVYTEFKFQFLHPAGEILNRFGGQRAKFLENIFRNSRRGKAWHSIDVVNVAEKLGEPRDRVVAALDYLDQTGEIVLQTAGLRQCYRVANLPADLKPVVAHLVERFSRREQHDIDRLRKVVALAECGGCYTRYLLEYFGEYRKNCGHCSRCAGAPQQVLPSKTRITISEADRAAVRSVLSENHSALKMPRQIARFLCGITSPATSKAKLRAHRDFGRLRHVPFREVLLLVESAAGVR